VNLTVEPQGAIPEAVAVISPLGTDIKTQPPFTLSIAIPVKEPLGVKRLTAVTRGPSDNKPIQAAIDVHVETTTPVIRIQIDPRGMLFSSSKQRSLSVIGIFADGQTRVITNSRETNYVSSNPQVATVTTDGLVKAVGEGTAMITVTYKDQSATVPVKVEFERQSLKIDILPGTFPNTGGDAEGRC
jgi:Bacterial Ig-like domain (group 2)